MVCATKADEVYDIVLFYKYVEVENAASVAEWVKELCVLHGLCGRAILAPEGINANLAGLQSKEGVQALIKAMKENPLFGADIDFKMDVMKSDKQPFPDLVIKVNKELCSTGGAMPLELLHQGLGGKHLTPAEFHRTLTSYWSNDKASGDMKDENQKSLVVLDVRNKREFALGRFQDGGEHQSIDPDTKLFAEWARYADKHIEEFKEKKVLMYCTGGIRCEKASAYLRSRGVDDVSQLAGGIHRYLETFGSDGYFKGKNAVFDARGVQVGEGQAEVIGRCTYCQCPEESISSDRVCGVCRDGVLVCDTCRVKKGGVYCCNSHMYLDGIYYPFLDGFSVEELQDHRGKLKSLEDTEHLKSSSNRRRSARKQINRVNERIEVLTAIMEGRGNERSVSNLSRKPYCRGCGRVGPTDLLALMGESKNVKEEEGVEACDGRCWGFMQVGRRDEYFDLDNASSASNAELKRSSGIETDAASLS
eukprot:CFRG3463T1